MIALFNFNTYLGGGETLFVRFVQYLENTGCEYKAFCLKDSFISTELSKRSINETNVARINYSSDYFYMNSSEREQLLNEINSHLQMAKELKLVTFCMRDLYTITALNNQYHTSVTHLILHNQDYLYVCQSVFDKFIYKTFGIRRFTSKKRKDFNRNLINIINNRQGIIAESWIIVKMWKRELGISIPEDTIVPPPCFDKNSRVELGNELFDKSILWIGRLVDFKFPSIYVILNFIKRNPDYRLTIVGNGRKDILDKYIKQNNIPLQNLTFMGEVAYADLQKVITSHSIGYASGSSIIEISKYRKPVVMALQNNSHKPFKKDICSGIFYKTTKGNFAEDLCIYKEDEIKCTIYDAMAEIEADYSGCAQKCFDYTAKEFDEQTNFAKYVYIINNTKPYIDEIGIPKASWLRRFFFKIMK